MDPEYEQGDPVVIAVGAWQGTPGEVLEHDQATDGSHMYEVQLEGDVSTWFFENEIMDPRSLNNN